MGGFAVEQEVEEAEAYRISLSVKSSCRVSRDLVGDQKGVYIYIPAFKILDIGGPLLSMRYHFSKEVGEAGTAELRRSGSI